MRPFCYNRSRNRIISSNTYTEHKAPAEDPGCFQSWRGNDIRQTDQKHKTDDSNNELIAVDKSASKNVTEIAKGELSNYVSYVGGCIHKPTQERGVVWTLPLQPSPVPMVIREQ